MSALTTCLLYSSSSLFAEWMKYTSPLRNMLCINNFLLCNKLPPNHKHSLSPGFCESGIWAWLSLVPLGAPGHDLLWGCSWATVTPRLSWGWGICLQVLTSGCWQWPHLGSSPHSPPIGCLCVLPTWQLANRERENKRRHPKGKTQSFL